MGFDASIVIPDLLLVGIPILVLLFWNKIQPKSIPGKLGFLPIPLKSLVQKTVAIVASLFVIALAITLLANFFVVNDLDAVQEKIDEITADGISVLVYLLIFRVFAEEVFFRGFLQQKVGIIPSTIMFGLGHALFGSVIEVIGALILGYMLALFMKRNNNIIPNIIGHFLYNIIAISVFL
jgi:membrane protease YdiL (CAAX protease family)